ncbi:hypothetical protein SALBM311S_03406 [Streptomyces alboniger]
MGQAPADPVPDGEVHLAGRAQPDVLVGGRSPSTGPSAGALIRGADEGFGQDTDEEAFGNDVDRSFGKDTDGTVTHAPAPHVDIVAAVGAGDAFAAGFLSGALRGLPLRDSLRHGHLWAAAALTAPGDLAPPPARDHADRLVALDDDAWGTLRLGPGWTQAAKRAEEEVRTP